MHVTNIGTNILQAPNHYCFVFFGFKCDFFHFVSLLENINEIRKPEKYSFRFSALLEGSFHTFCCRSNTFLHLLHSKWISLFVVQVLLQVEEGVEEDVSHPTALQIAQAYLS